MHKDLVLDDVIVWILTESHQRYFTRFFIGNIAYGSKYTITAPRSDLSNPEERGLPYHSPHKFRHGHMQYALANAETIADSKAVSMNVMQACVEITDELVQI